MNDWIRLHSGGKFHFLNPRINEINIEDIVWNLSHICRFTGATKKFYCVAQHSCIVHDILPDELKPEGLLHDATESTMSDLNSVVKSLLPAYKKMEVRVEKIFAEKFNLDFPYDPRVKEADLIALATEKRDLMPGNDHLSLPYEPLPAKIVPWSIEKSRREFMKRFNKLYKK